MQDYVEKRDGGFYIAGTQIALDGVIRAFRNGASPESILYSFPLTGSLERVYGVITFYLANQAAVEEYLNEQEKLWQEAQAAQTPLPAPFADELHRARHGLLQG